MNSFVVEKPISSTPIESNKLLHICSQCTRTFKDINNFREHLFQEHGELGVNVRQCHLCSYATLLKSKYDCHIRCHLNNRVIRCQKCNYSTINIRHMSKHERLHSLNSNANNNNNSTINSNENSLREVKRARLDTDNSSPNSNWSTALFINTKFKDEQSTTSFSSCFSTDKLLMPDPKKSENDSQNIRLLETFRSNSSQSIDDTSSCTPCLHQNNLLTLRTNIWTLLRMLFPQLSIYYPSISINDYESDQSIDRLVANLIQLPSLYNSHSSV